MSYEYQIIKAEIEAVESIIPESYTVKQDNKHLSSLRCRSNDGMSEEQWEQFKLDCQVLFEERLMEFYHEVNYRHKDFIIYLKP